MFPSLSQNLTPLAAAYGFTELQLPSTLHISVLETIDLTEKMMASLLSLLDINPDAYLCISLDAEWNVSRHIGVSIIQIAPHDDPDTIFVIPVCVLLNSRPWLTCHSRFTSSTRCHRLFYNF